ncbi:hypothetical protein [Novosphingobium sp. NBM11]|uniref:hypothetical protein n=1 Tax=Novosphingobium sp. NBM11 TaxID=2596914 RepID=UPI0021027844|nr:hypothetical protein [Novosphingobium sp. NBM11]
MLVEPSTAVLRPKLPADFPGPVVRQLAAQPEGALPGIGLLEEVARAGFGEAALGQDQVLAGRIGRIAGWYREIAQRAGCRDLIRLAERIEELAERLDTVGQRIVREEGRADALDWADRIEKRVRVEVVLGGTVRLVEVPVPSGYLVEVDLLAVGPAPRVRRSSRRC